MRLYWAFIRNKARIALAKAFPWRKDYDESENEMDYEGAEERAARMEHYRDLKEGR